MKRLIIARWFVVAAMMFCSGLITGWWLHHRIPVPVEQAQDVPELLSSWQPVPSSRELWSDKLEAEQPLSDFESALVEQRLDDALVLYQQQERAGSITELRRVLIRTVKNWGANSQQDKAINTLERFTQHYYQDQELLSELARLYLNEKELTKSLETLLNARSFLIPGKDYEHLSGEILNLAKRIFKENAVKQKLEASLSLFQKLTMLEPEQGFYRYALVESYLAINDLNSAIAELEILQLDPEYEKKASDMLLALLPPPVEAAEEKQTAGITLQHTGKHYIATVTLQNNTNVQLLLDTGASLTTLPDELLLELKRRKMAHRVSHANISTAGGTVFAPIYLVKEVTLGQFVLKNLEVAGMSSGTAQADGLLGMNALRQFHFQIDQDRSQLLLTPR
ncbi:hypothetical protein EOPP23_08655 [Endozoicomonas sp. OPT23]|uniref:retropepsin-like aspartic protease n=1 Tax=Endozoicomonas sp. OPT23 TaxID=2072845 RepID=UPI00129A8D4D|nr:retropepsin-like aspartic protease [Endozoicomonas sp. OPT23]MRI33052.1 hypothetical protein [Endozoicomonas sp. OPT23]